MKSELLEKYEAVAKVHTELVNKYQLKLNQFLKYDTSMLTEDQLAEYMDSYRKLSAAWGEYLDSIRGTIKEHSRWYGEGRYMGD